MSAPTTASARAATAGKVFIVSSPKRIYRQKIAWNDPSGPAPGQQSPARRSDKLPSVTGRSAGLAAKGLVSLYAQARAWPKLETSTPDQADRRAAD